jgi:hypothetical protein
LWLWKNIHNTTKPLVSAAFTSPSRQAIELKKCFFKSIIFNYVVFSQKHPDSDIYACTTINAITKEIKQEEGIKQQQRTCKNIASHAMFLYLSSDYRTLRLREVAIAKGICLFWVERHRKGEERWNAPP